MDACILARASQRRPTNTKPGRRGFATLTLVLLAGCNDAMTNGRHQDVLVPHVVVFYSEAGDGQTAEVGTALSQPLVVRLFEQNGAPAAGVEVRFTGSGDPLDLISRSDAQGRATMWWRLGSGAGAQSIEASVVAPNAPPVVTFRAEALAGPATQIRVTAENPVALPGTQLDTLAASVFDRYSNPIANGDISWSVQSGGGSIQPLSERTDSHGRARAVWRLGPSAGPQNLVIASGTARRVLVANPVLAMVATQISSGADHSCAIVEDGTAYCWGSNAWGQLGFGSRDWNPHPLPLPVLGGLKFKEISAGASHSCGLTLAGATYCWGGNLSGQMGTEPSWDVVTRPTRIAGVPPLATIAAGGFHTCGLTSAGAAFCWGDNSLGQLGDGADRSTAVEYTRGGQSSPVPVAGLHVFTSIHAHWTVTCGLTSSGDAYCWGGNDMLNLGGSVTQTCRFVYRGENGDLEIYGDNPCSTVPVRVVTSATASSITLAQNGACAVLTNGGLECWGFYHARPTLIAGAQVTRAWLFSSTVCGMGASGSISCQYVVAPFAAARPFGNGPALVNIHSSGRHHCGLSSDPLGTAYCWDTNYDGALGDGTTQWREYPVPVALPYAQRVP